MLGLKIICCIIIHFFEDENPIIYFPNFVFPV